MVFPRFLVQADIETEVYMNLILLYFFASLGIFLTLVFYSKITFIFQILMLIAQIMSFKLLYSIHKKSLVKVKEDTKWILIAFFSGLLSHSLFIISNFDFSYSYEFSKFAINGGFYLFIFMIIFTISQRMFPFFTTAKAPTYKINKSENLPILIFSLLV